MKKYLIWYIYPYLHEINLNTPLLDRLDGLYKNNIEYNDNSKKSFKQNLLEIEVFSKKLVQYFHQSKINVYFYCLSVVSISIIETLFRHKIRIECIFDDARNCDNGYYQGVKIEKNYANYLEKATTNEKNLLIIGHLDQKVGRNIASKVKKQSNSFFFRMFVVDSPLRMLELDFSVVKKQNFFKADDNKNF